MKLILSLAFSLASINLLAADKPKVEKEKEWHDHEIAASGEVHIAGKIDKKDFLACSQPESIPFTQELPSAWSEKVFQKSELEDLKKCKPGSCAFNLLPYEVEYLSKLKSTERKKESFLQFYKDRVDGKTPIDPRRSHLLIRSKDQKFGFCQSNNLNRLLDKRPIESKSFRLAFANYDSRMRPTLRLVQPAHYPGKSGWYCYVEALIFSDHYDGERVDLWGYRYNSEEKTSVLRLEIRNRMDFLHSWWRRLQKSGLRDRIQSVVADQLTEASNCLKRRQNGQKSAP